MGHPVLAHSDSPSLGPIWAPGGEDAPGRVGRAERADVPALGWRCLPGGSLHGLPPRQTPRPSPHVEAVGPSGLWPHLGSRGTWASLGNPPHQALEAGSVRLREEVLGDRTADGGHVRPGDLPARRGVAGEWGTRPAGVRRASARPSESPGGGRAAPVCPGFLCADGMCHSLARHHLPPVSEVQTGAAAVARPVTVIRVRRPGSGRAACRRPCVTWASRSRGSCSGSWEAAGAQGSQPRGLC